MVAEKQTFRRAEKGGKLPVGSIAPAANDQRVIPSLAAPTGGRREEAASAAAGYGM
jgi:hypothetical protein